VPSPTRRARRPAWSDACRLAAHGLRLERGWSRGLERGWSCRARPARARRHPDGVSEDADVAGGAARARSHFCAAAGPYRPAASRPQVRRVAATALHGRLCHCPGKRLGTRVDRGRFRVSPVAQVREFVSP
ncbi:hypothetical protein T492DRAFT_1142423, partial [Pavlovales sp. CCMP2436]